MRVRNNKNQIFEKAVTTKTSVAVFGIFMFILMYWCAWLLLYLLYKETQSIIGLSITWVVVYGILVVLNIGLFSGKLSERANDKPFIQLKEWKKNDLWKEVLNNIQAANNANYYQNKSLNIFFQKQLFWLNICVASIWVSVWWFFVITFIYPFTEKKLYFFIGVIGSIIFTYLIYYFWKKYRMVKIITKKWNICVLKRNITKYYIYQDWVYFY